MDQLTRSNEKEPLRSPNVLADSNTFGTDEIRQIQMLMVLLSCLPQNGKVREACELALALPHEPCSSRISPLRDISFHGLKTWLESLWVQKELSPAEQKLVDWQRSGENMSAAVLELKEAEQKIGMKFGIHRIL